VRPIARHLGPTARALADYWASLPAPGFVPERRNFDPMRITRILPTISVLQREADDRWCFRVAGTEIERRWARHVTGSNYFDIDFVSPAAAEIMRREFGTMAAWPCGSWSRREVVFVSRRRAAIETLRLPLRANDGTTSLLVSCSEEFCAPGAPDPDAPREIIRIVDQQFLDIGAGCPGTGALAAPEAPARVTVAETPESDTAR